MAVYRVRAWSVVLLAAALLIACQPTAQPLECTDAIGCVEIAPGETLRLGVLQALSGGMAHVGADQVRGIELALAARGERVLDHPIELQIEDARCTSEGGIIASMKVVADSRVVAVLGTTCSGSAETAAKVVSEAGLVMISGLNTAPSLTSSGGEPGIHWQSGYLRVATNDSLLAETVATFAFRELGLTRAATIHDGDSYTRGYSEVFEQAFSALGGEVVLTAVVDKGDRDMHPVLTAVAISGADIAFFPLLSPEADLIVLQAREVDGLENVVLMGGGALLTESSLQSVGQAGLGIYIAGRLPLDTPALDQLNSTYEARYGVLPRTNTPGQAFDSANLLLEGIEAVAARDVDGRLYIGRQALRDALHATTDLVGVSGSFTCDAFGDCSRELSKIMHLADPAAGLDGLLSNVVYAPDQ